MNKTYGSQSMIEPLRRVLVRRPDEAFGQADPLRWHYTSQPNLALAQQEHDAFVASLAQAGVEVIYHEEALPDHADAIYVHDPALVTDQGAIILSMSKSLRQGEEQAMTHCFEALDIPILYTLHGQARAEGGDLLWLDEQTLAVGLSFRTNAAGLRQLGEALNELKVELIPVQMPYYQGPEACLHLMSLMSLVDYRLAVVYLPLLAVPFYQYLKDHDYQLIEIPAEEFETQATNVLALAPGQCLMLEGNPVTRQRLEAAGCEVLTYRGNEISFKSEGGPTCLTRPILRER
jgi:N-dimethylarginine dimethylaminohydrolase